MLASQLFQLLSRSEVREIVLLVGKPPCALVDGTFRRLSAQLLREDDVIAVLAAARGQDYLAQLADGVRWEFQLPSIGSIQVSAVYDGPVLKASLRLASQAAGVRARVPKAAPAAAEPAVTRHRPSPPPERRPAAARPDLEPLELAGRSEPAFETAAADSGPEAFELTRFDPHAPDDAGFEPQAAPRGVLSLGPPSMAAETLGQGDRLDAVLGRARQLHASDVHLLADRPAMLRIAGDLVRDGDAVAAAEVEQLVLARVPERLHATLREQGSCDFPLVHPHYGRFRVNVCVQRTGYKLTARPIGKRVPTLAELGLPEAIAQAVHHHQGLIVITGPTGHGKTTTLAAIVGILNRETSHHVITVEDPIEYVHERAQAIISQREVGTHTLSFQAALKGSLREDPDVIVVGELRDTETVRMALTASETGHLVISTMNTPSAAKAIERLIDLFPPGDQPQVRMTLAGGLRLIISQRLLPSADRTQLCAAAEILPGSVPLWNLIRDNRTFQISSLQQRGKSLGIVRLDDSLAQLVKSQRTSLEIACEYADSPEYVEGIVNGRPAAAQGQAQPANAPPGAANVQRGVELGKQVLSRAGKLFGGDNR